MDTFARDGLPPAGQWPDLLLLDGPDRVNAAAELLAHEGTAIAGGWSYDELRSRAEAIAASLEIEPGTRVLLHAPNSAETIAAWFGILFAGGIVVATMPLLLSGAMIFMKTCRSEQPSMIAASRISLGTSRKNPRSSQMAKGRLNVE